MSLPAFLGFGAGYGARYLGINPLNASLIGLGVGVVYSAGGFGFLVSATTWVATDLGAGVVAAAGASTIVGATAAVAIPVIVGGAVAAIIGGEEGLDQYTDVITGQVSLADYDEVLVAAYNRFEGVSNLAVAGNAAGIPEGTNMGNSWERKNIHSPLNPFTGEENPAYVGPSNQRKNWGS